MSITGVMGLIGLALTFFLFIKNEEKWAIAVFIITAVLFELLRENSFFF